MDGLRSIKREEHRYSTVKARQRNDDYAASICLSATDVAN